MSPLVAYILAAMMAWYPVDKHAFREHRIITEARYLQIATVIVDTAFDPLEIPLFEGPDARLDTALELASVGEFESGGFATDVQFCRKFGDHGKAHGLFQSHLSAKSVCFSLEQAAHIALKQMRESYNACPR